MPSLCMQDRQITHPHAANLPKGRDIKEAEQSEASGETGDGGATRSEPSDFAALSRSRNVAAGASAPPAKNGPDAFFPAAPSPPVCRAQYGRRNDRQLLLKLGWQARLSGRGQGRRWRSTHTTHPPRLPPPRGAGAAPATRPLSQPQRAPRLTQGIAWDTIVQPKREPEAKRKPRALVHKGWVWAGKGDYVGLSAPSPDTSSPLGGRRGGGREGGRERRREPAWGLLCFSPCPAGGPGVPAVPKPGSPPRDACPAREAARPKLTIEPRGRSKRVGRRVDPGP